MKKLITNKKVLVVSHTVFSDTGNMGKTMKEMFEYMQTENLIQLYFHSEIPQIKTCKSYFRITDLDVLQSIITRKFNFKKIESSDIKEQLSSNSENSEIVETLYRVGKTRGPLIYLLRNLMWTLGVWKRKSLWDWIEEEQPDVIFFASGDYSFAYKIVHKISTKFDIPVITWCCDDFYLENNLKKTLLEKYNYKNLMKWVYRVMDRTSSIITISDKMNYEYGKMFGKNICTLRTPAPVNPYAKNMEERKGIVYVGNLSLNRYVSLVELGKKIKEMQIPDIESIDVYANENNEKILELLTEENGIRFHGPISSDEVQKVLGGAKFVLSVEAFDEKSRARTYCSLSTKVAESLQSGACVVAYGPKEISSMEYLINENAACYAETAEKMVQQIEMLNNDRDMYGQYVQSARKLAQKNHDKSINSDILQRIIENIG